MNVMERLPGCLALVLVMGLHAAEPALAQQTLPPEQIDFSEYSDLAMWSALVAMVVPWVVAWLNRASTRSTVRWTVFAAVCVIAAIGTAFFQGHLALGAGGVIRSLLIIATLAGVYFRLWHGALKEFERDHDAGAQ